MMTHFAMLQRNLLYTGVTRAKKIMVLVGQKKAVGYCVKNMTVDKRNTLLAERLSGKAVRSLAPVQAPYAADSRYVCFDVETPNHHNEHVSAIGISVIENGIITDEFFSYVNPDQPFDSFNTELTGISAATVAPAPNFAGLWPRIESIMSSGILVAHNAPFDLGVLKKCLQDYHITWKDKVPYLCTVRIGRSVLPGMSHRLNDMCSYYHIELDHHKADSDSHACAEILLHYMQDNVNVNDYIRSWWMK